MVLSVVFSGENIAVMRLDVPMKIRLPSSLNFNSTEVAGVMTTCAGGRTLRAMLIMVSETMVDKSPDSSDDKSELLAIKELLKINIIKNHHRNRWSLKTFLSI
jgi:hypothetical protein